MYVLFPSLSTGEANNGAETKVTAPVDELIAKRAASMPEIDQVKVAPESGSPPKNLLTEVCRSLIVIP
jgi:hypothetical protein